MKPPKVLFRTNVYHPNIDKLGQICLNILKGDWTPVIKIKTVLISLQGLLSAPNLEDPLDAQIAQHWRVDPEGAIATAREWTIKYAM